jgi:hypothetical protein
MTDWFRQFLFLCFLALALTACDKTYPGDNITVIEGVVVDATTMKPVPFAWVSVNAMSYNAGWGGHAPIALIQADSDGRFEYSFNSSSNYSYRLRGEGIEGLYDRGSETTSIDQGERNRDLIATIGPLAWVKVIIYPPEDVLVPRINVRSFKDYPRSYTFTNLRKDTSFIAPMPGNGINRIFWSVRIQGETTTYNGEVFLPAHDTTEFKIEIEE